MAMEQLDVTATAAEMGEQALGGATRLAVLLQQRNWDRYGVFRVEYEKAAKRVDRHLVASVPSRAQWHRWVTGELRRLPYVDHCRVLEAMLPGWSARQLFSPPSEDGPESGRESASAHHGPQPGSTAVPGDIPDQNCHADVTAVFVSRTDFTDNVSPIDLFDSATQIRAAGLSLNLLCQQFADQRLRQLVEAGTYLHALFLQPDGQAITEREVEEGISPGHLSALTKLNIDLLLRLRSEAPVEVRNNLQIGVYDETIRFNVTLVDDRVCVFQPYLPAMRGVDSPTFLIHRDAGQRGLFDTFERVFTGLAERSTPL